MSSVFIVHGHDHAALYRLKDWLRDVGADPIVLIDRPSQGMTIIEKFEKHGGKADFAIALLTPDDKQAADLPPGERYRSRQNVIFEIGWFMARLGRRKVILLHKGEVELPSDVLGVIYYSFRDSVNEVLDSVRSELVSQGVIY
jgi:predicted nucleotide-binding protein